jgi:predicted enzyme related to lactoylglutathione lyase
LIPIPTQGTARVTQQKDLPLGLVEDHLNLVFSVADGPSTETFYGDIMGLRRIPNAELPGGRYMVRYHGGATELKFIVGAEAKAPLLSDPSSARGIRALHLQLPESRRKAVFSRLSEYGVAEPKALETPTQPTRYRLLDLEGNQVELMFVVDEPTDPDLVRMQFGFSVSNLVESGLFLEQVLGMTASLTQDASNQYVLGQSAINLWKVPSDRPALVGMPHEMRGMSLLQFVVHDIPKAREIILARGGSVHTEPYDVGDLAVVMFIEGPDGILIEFGAAL